MPSVDDASSGESGKQPEALQRQLEEQTAEIARNDDKMRRSQQRELRLLQAEDLESLFCTLTEGLRASYGLQKVTVVLGDPDHDIRHLLLAGGTAPEAIQDLLIVESLTAMAPQYVALRSPWLGAFAACDHQLVLPGEHEIASVAMIPLKFRDKLIGSVNLGSDESSRFTRGHASDFLAHLGVIASFAIENGVNRARLLRSGFTDVLTGWHNRRYLQVRMREELSRAQREKGNLVCLMLDVDHFKRINDTWGHAAGDTVLREIAQRIESQVRTSDVNARYGGEEFVVLLPGTELEAGSKLAERIRRAVSADLVELPNGEQTNVAISIGIADVVPAADVKDLKTVGESLLARADVALYRAKSAGRDRVELEKAS